MIRKKKILVDMSCSILHYGHIRLLKKASKFGNVIVALTSDNEIKKQLSGNLCRCTGYNNIVISVAEAAKNIKKFEREKNNV